MERQRAPQPDFQLSPPAIELFRTRAHYIRMASNKEWKWGYITPQGQFAICPAFDGASDFSEGLAAVKTGWAAGYIDRTGAYAIAPAFGAAEEFRDGIATVRLDGARLCIDRAGNIIGEAPPAPAPEFESGFDPHYEFHDGLVRFVENQKFGYKDREGRVIVKPRFFDACDFSEGLAAVRNGKTSAWGYIDTAGRLAVPPRFRQAKPFRDGLAAVLVAVGTDTGE